MYLKHNWVLLVVIGFTLILTGCLEEYDPSMKNLDDSKSLARIKELQSKTGFDFSKVVAVRLSINGETVNVTSLRPEKLAGFSSGSDESMTLASINQKKDALIMFTRDGERKIGYEIQLALSDVDKQRKILFPVADTKEKKIVNSTIMLLEVSVR